MIAQSGFERAMPWGVDPKGQRLIGNPEHGGEHMIEVRKALANRG